jgi:hypothetical protein
VSGYRSRKFNFVWVGIGVTNPYDNIFCSSSSKYHSIVSDKQYFLNLLVDVPVNMLLTLIWYYMK